MSKEGNKRKKKKIKKICGDDKWLRRKVGGSFPHFLINTGRREKKRDEKKEKEKEEKMKEKMKKKKREWSKQKEFGGISGKIRKKKKIRKERRRGKIRKRSREKERKKKKEKGVFRFSLRSTEIGLSVFVGVRSKVGPRNERYAWVPKYGSFIKLQEVENFSTWIISSLKFI